MKRKLAALPISVLMFCGLFFEPAFADEAPPIILLPTYSRPGAFYASGDSGSAVFTYAAHRRRHRRHRVVRRRSKRKSAAIIGGSAAGGAAIGALAGGGKGAAIGALVGGAGGAVYDRKTHKTVVR